MSALYRNALLPEDEHDCPPDERCKVCHSLPIDMLHDGLRDALRQVAKDACARHRVEPVEAIVDLTAEELSDPFVRARKVA